MKPAIKTILICLASILLILPALSATNTSLGVNLGINKWDDKGVPGDIAQFIVDIENKGNLSDTYSISVTGPIECTIALNETRITLSPGEKKQVLIQVVAKEKATPQIYEYIVTARSFSDIDIQDKQFFRYEVVPTGNVQVSLSTDKQEYSLRSEIQLSINLLNKVGIELKNLKGQILVEGPKGVVYKNWINIEKIEAEENIINKFTIENLDAIPGDYNLSFILQSCTDCKNPKIYGQGTSGIKITEYKNLIEKRTSSSSFLTETTTILVSNNGNVNDEKEVLFEISGWKKYLLSLSKNPSFATNTGYSWVISVEPGKEESVTCTVSYLPIYLAIFAILGIFLIYLLTRKERILVEKSVVKQSVGGNKITIKVYLKKVGRLRAHDVILKDIIPGIAEVESFSVIKPDIIDDKRRHVTWKIGSMESGEERVFTYTLGSKVAVFGSMKLEPAQVSYKLQGKHNFEFSNSPTIEGV